MCGIAGCMPATGEQLFKKALDSIAHRGPDGYGIWTEDDSSIMLGHRRLAILDLSDKGKQPMMWQDRYVISFNGEIYNFIEIRKELILKGYHFLTESDTEVILAAFDAWGHECLQRFNGMWALAIWDRNKKSLFLSRDRYGKKPLFYSFANNRFAFGSEMKALAFLAGEAEISPEFDWCRQNVFLYESTEKTLLKNISRFPAACFAYLAPGMRELKPVKYYSTADHLVAVPRSYEEQTEKFREIFIDACSIRMRSDVAIGTALSGGLDSSAVMSTIAYIERHNRGERMNTDWQHAFVASFPGSAIDEKKYAKQVADHLEIPATYLEIDPVKGIDQLMDDLWYFEELYITSPVPMMRTYAAIRQHGVRVSIDGHGADEMMSGYGPDLLEALPDAGLNIRQIKSIIQTYRDYKDMPEKDRTAKQGRRIYTSLMKSRLPTLSSAVAYYARAAIKRHKPNYWLYPEMGYLNNILYDLFHVSVLPTLLRNYDRYSMASGVEIRMPFMDHRLVEYAFSLPWSSKIRKGYTKAVIRDATSAYMPEAIARRKSKIGFNTPIVEWLQGPWKEYFLDHMASGDFLNSGLINAKAVQKKVNDVIDNPAATWTQGEEAWYAMQPYFWQKGFFERLKAGVC